MEAERKVGWTVAAASFGFALIQLDVTVVNVALPRLGAELHAGTAGLQWVVDAYALVFSALLLTAGALGDRWGPKKTYVGGIVLFALASIACGASPSPAMLVAARAVQGAGAALMLPTSLAVLNHACGHDAALRARMVGMWTAAGGAAVAAGPVLGGLLLGITSWRSIFLINFPVCVVGCILTVLKVEAGGAGEARRGLDLPGQGCAIVALGALTGGVIEARPLGLGSPWVIGALALFIGAGGAFIAVEKHSASPMLPLRYFGLPGFSPAVVFGFFVNLTYYGIIFVLTLYLQRTLRYSALRAGLAYLPLTATFIFINTVSGWLVGRMGPRLPMAVGSLVGAAGYGLLVMAGPHSHYPALIPGFVLIPLGVGLAVPAMTTAVLASVGKAASGIASGVLNAARQAGGAMGVALFGSLAGSGIVPGLHGSAAISGGLLVLAAGLAAKAIRPGRTG